MNADETLARLIEECVKAKSNSYSPYSKFKVGAALLCKDNSIVTGCNVENCSYGLAICAEQVAIVKAISNGCKEFKAMAVSSDAKNLTPPCGRCRQFILEFGNIDLYLVNGDGSVVKKMALASLLPNAFGPKDLNC